MKILFSRQARLLVFIMLAATSRSAVGQSGVAATSVLVLRSDSLRQKGDLQRAIETLREALVADTASAQARFHLAYALLSANRTAEAIGVFWDGLARDSSYRDGFRQLGYLYRAAGQPDSAFRAFLSAQRISQLSPRDWVEVGYIQTARGNPVAAQDAFGTARMEGDSMVRALATQALAGNAAPLLATNGKAAQPRGYMEVYAAPLYQTRFTNAIGQGFVRLGLAGASSALSPYLSVRLTRDSRSMGGTQPQIYSDNSLIAAVGLKTQPFQGGPTLYAEAGPAFMLIDDGRDRVRADARAGAYYFNGWYETRALRTELYTDASYYSRFNRNVITYLQLREILDAWRPGTHAVELFARLGGVVDSRRVSYNNAGEFAPGMAFIPGPTRRVVLTLEHVSGRYFVDAFPGATPRYADVRAMLVFYALAPLGAR